MTDLPEALFGGCRDDDARAARERLARRLLDAGVPLGEIVAAQAEDRLVLLPVERVLAGEPRYTADEFAAAAGVDLDVLRRFRQALGLPQAEPGARVFTEDDVGPARTVGELIAAGVDTDDLLETVRVMGAGMRRYAESIRWTRGQAIVRPGVAEDEVAASFARAAENLLPLASAATENAFRLHLLEVLRQDVLSAEQLETGELAGSEDVAVAFADLVGFTKLGESVGGEELGSVAVRLGALAAERIEPSVRLVKTIGDAVMLVSRDVTALVESALALVDAAEADEELPALRVGVAYGPAVARYGDWYGATVNTASRVCGRARPASVLVTEPVKDSAPDAFTWRFAGTHKLRGVKEAPPLFRARRL
jgi:adenylate cyclase